MLFPKSISQLIAGIGLKGGGERQRVDQQSLSASSGEPCSYNESPLVGARHHIAKLLFLACCTTIQANADETALPIPNDIATLTASREALANDPHRPRYHLSSPIGTLHDPGGFAYWKGKYHLFYISPGGKGHAVSEDMVHWKDRARIPGIAGLTGQMQVTENEAWLSFARGTNGVYLARSKDPDLSSWTTWKALSGDELQADHSTPIDSFFWQEDDQWWMILRQAKERTGLYHWDNKVPRLSLFHSRDLRKWTRHPEPFFEKRYGIERGHDLACASLMPIGKHRHLLYYFVHARGPAYTIGRYDKQKLSFEEEHSQLFSFGPVLYGSLHAPSGLITPDGRLVTIFNITENMGTKREVITEGWKGMMSLPRVLSLHKDYGKPPVLQERPFIIESNLRDFFNPLQIEPVAELKSLRGESVRIENLTVESGKEVVLPNVSGRALEIEAEIDFREAREVSLDILHSPAGEERTRIRIFREAWHGRSENAHTLSIDVSESSLDPRVPARTPESGPLWLEEDAPLRLRVFIDHSVVEVFANDRQCLTIRTYPSREDSQLVSFRARGGSATLKQLTAWKMKSIWPELAE